MQKPSGNKVLGLTRKKVRHIASLARNALNVGSGAVNIVDIYDFQLHEYGVSVHYGTADDTQGNDGLTLPDKGEIIIREDVYLGACNNHYKDRFTLAHELGHLILHSGVPFARNTSPQSDHRWFEDSEWQANNFAAEFMLPVGEILEKCSSAQNIVDHFQMSLDCSKRRIQTLNKEGIIEIKKGPELQFRPS